MVSVKSLLHNVRYMIHLGKPRLVVRSAYNYFRYLVGRKPRLRYVDVIMDYACNLKCEHCSCETLKDAGRRKMTADDWAMVARQSEKLGSVIFGVQGGEPLVHRDLEKVLANLNPKKNFISVKTNGTIASEDLFRRLKKIGVDSITVGLGPIPNEYEFEDYDRMSRCLKDAFSKSLKSVKMIHDAGIKPMLSVVISSRNIGSRVFQGVIRLAREYGAILNCALAVPVGSWENSQDLMLTADDRKKLNQIMKENSHVRTDFESNWSKRGCGACKEKIYISPYGDVLPCPFVHISFGNVLEEPLEAIWKRACQPKAFAEYAPVCVAAEDKKFLTYLDVAHGKGVKLPIRYDVPEVAEVLDTTYEQRSRSL